MRRINMVLARSLSIVLGTLLLCIAVSPGSTALAQESQPAQATPIAADPTATTAPMAESSLSAAVIDMFQFEDAFVVGVGAGSMVLLAAASGGGTMQFSVSVQDWSVITGVTISPAGDSCILTQTD